MNAVREPRPAGVLRSECRLLLQQGREALHQRYLQRPSPEAMLRAHARLVDRVLLRLWQALDAPPGAALAAVGGYGRRELYPCSDVDVLVLIAHHDAAVSAFAERLVGLLWDVGLEIGHSVRTLDECLEEARRDLTVATNLAELRAVAGDSAALTGLAGRLRAQTDRRAFIEGKLEEQHQRHLRNNDTAFNLEPNIKESPGGLRDLQTLIWLAWGAGIGADWDALVRRGVLSAEEARRARRDQHVLQDLRIRLHLLAGRREDRLLFDFQHRLAEQFGFRDQGHHRASEFLMQRFFRTAKSVSLLNTILVSQIRSWRPDPRVRTAIPIDDDFAAWGDLLGAREDNAFERRPQLIFRALLTLQRHGNLRGFTPDALRSLWRARKSIDGAFRRDPENRRLFMEILREPRRVTNVLRRLNRYGLLGRYIPAFGRIEGQMQHDLFHVYTVDEHILRVLRNVRRFAVAEFDHEFPLCSRLMNDFERPEVLYLAALFHDIAKGRGGDHSALGGGDARTFCLHHGVSARDTALVVWLVQQHLTMSATAQKQDLSDPEVVEAFARRVGDERHLVALYLLTVADIRGTSPKVWNAWKGKLLEDLFQSTRRQLQGGAGSLAEALALKRGETARILRQYALDESRYQAFWASLDDEYFRRHEAQEIAWHTRCLHARHDAGEPVVRARLSPLGEGIQVMIYAPDETALFARICGFFERLGYSIVEAKIYTTTQGQALDSFQVLARGREAGHYRDVLAYVEQELRAQLIGPPALARPHSARISRHLRHFPIPARAGLSTPDRAGLRVLTLTAGDRPGLLYRVALVLLEHAVRLRGAKITTLGERAEDSLLISGDTLQLPEAQEALKHDLLEALEPA
ncbi:MAG: [protein-PII] uridylyltransferase [Pseudomonadota bacterium]|nr:[protein-PII] uridylyltransferase [Pseudomonadota bacterium]